MEPSASQPENRTSAGFGPHDSIAAIMQRWPRTVPVFLRRRMGCVGCSLAEFDSLADAAQAHALPLAILLDDLADILPPGVLSTFNDQHSTWNLQPVTNNSQFPTPKGTPMTLPYTHIPDLSDLLPEISADTIISKTYHSDANVKVILFGFAPGQELSEHTSAKPAILHFLKGEAQLTLGKDEYQVSAGAWTQMPPNLAHSILAKDEVWMLLYMLEKGGA